MRQTASVEDFIAEFDIGDKSAEQSLQTLSGIHSTSVPRHEGNGSGRKIVPGAIVKFALLYPTFPINAIYHTKQWQHSDFKYVLCSDNVFERAISSIQTQMCQW